MYFHQTHGTTGFGMRAMINLFYRYQLATYFNENPKNSYPYENYRETISDAQYELEQMTNDIKEIVKNLINQN